MCGVSKGTLGGSHCLPDIPPGISEKRISQRWQGGFTMQDGRLISLRQEASRGYDLSISGEAGAGYMQAIMLAEIALQLAKLNETLADIAKDMSVVKH